MDTKTETKTNNKTLTVRDILNTVPCDETQQVKVWDTTLQSWESGKRGRIRIVARITKGLTDAKGKCKTLKNVYFGIAWCSPTDSKQYNRKKATEIAVGRLKAQIANSLSISANSGVLPELTSLKNFVEIALSACANDLPHWIDPDQFINDNLRDTAINRVWCNQFAPPWFYAKHIKTNYKGV